jgi:hypothetical protein
MGNISVPPPSSAHRDGASSSANGTPSIPAIDSSFTSSSISSPSPLVLVASGAVVADVVTDGAPADDHDNGGDDVDKSVPNLPNPNESVGDFVSDDADVDDHAVAGDAIPPNELSDVAPDGI